MALGKGSLAELERLKAEHRERFKAKAPKVRRINQRMPLDQNLAAEMATLAAHFERPGPMPAIVEDEARDAAEMIGWSPR